MIKNNNVIRFLGMWLVVAVALVCARSLYGQGPQTPSASTQAAVRMLEQRVDEFEKVLSSEIDKSKFNETESEDMIDAYVDELELSTDRLRRRADRGPIAWDVSQVLGDALRVEDFVEKNSLPANVKTSWAAVKTPLDQLAKTYGIAWVWKAQNYPTLSDENRDRVILRLEDTADDFRVSFDNALELGRADGTSYEDHMMSVVRTFENALDDLADGDQRDKADEKSVLTVLNNAKAIEGYMSRYKMTPRAVVDWYRVRANLDDLARMYKVTWTWAPRVGPDATPATDAKKPDTN